ncbi:MAG: SH3 domain-containing protein [Anaerolineae bacterium]
MFQSIRLFRWIVLIASLVATVLYSAAIYAADLPPALWYAVAWVPTTDRLHWINANGEQADIPRPVMPNESPVSNATHVHIAPNGRTLVSVAPLQNGHWGIGFYDLSTGQWIQTHETQENEGPATRYSADFTLTSSHFATVLRNAQSGDWRVLVFETATGNAIAQLSRSDAFLPDTFYDDPSYHPVIAAFDIDEGLGTYDLRLQHLSATIDPYLYVGSFHWYPLPPPALASAPVIPDDILYSPVPGIDVLETTGQVVLATFDSNLGVPDSMAIGDRISLLNPGQPMAAPLVTDNAYTLNNPQWLRGGEWIGYRVQNDGIYQPHFAITTLEGGDGLPLGPNIGAIAGTPDGFVAVDTMNWQLYHATDLNMDGFAAFFGNTVFQSGQPFSIVYTTPAGAVFALTTLAESATPNDLGFAALTTPTPTDAPDLAPLIPACSGAPAPRLTPGSTARVAITNGAPLNLRNAPAGDRVGQLPEGRVFAVVNTPPQCADSYLWWNIQLNDGTTYWVAEGTMSGYFVEPYQETFQPGVIVVLPTATPVPPVLIPLPTATLAPMIFIPLATATPLSLVLTVECSNSPQTRVSIGSTAHVVGIEGTLAVYSTATEQFPTYQLPLQKTVTIIAGPQCRDGVRMWQINTTLNNSPITGWVAEGFGQTYYLQPGPGRAL